MWVCKILLLLIGSVNIARHPLCFPVRKNQVVPHEMLIKTPIFLDGRLQLLSGELPTQCYLSGEERETEINTKLSAWIRVRMLIRAAWSGKHPSRTVTPSVSTWIASPSNQSDQCSDN